MIGTEIIDKSVPLTIANDKNQDQTRPENNIVIDEIVLPNNDDEENKMVLDHAQPEHDHCVKHSCDSTFQTVQEINKHISGNLHDFCIHN